MVKCYVASKYENKEDVRKLMYALIEHGHTITEDWTHSLEENNNNAAVACWQGVVNCEVFIGLFDKPYQFKGAYVELGIAIALHKIIVIIGHHADAQTFIHLSWLHKFETIEEFLEYITVGPRNSEHPSLELTPHQQPPSQEPV